jgi:hypothetical protein
MQAFSKINIFREVRTLRHLALWPSKRLNIYARLRGLKLSKRDKIKIVVFEKQQFLKLRGKYYAYLIILDEGQLRANQSFFACE